MADYISRQKAIEAIMDLPNCPNGYSDTYDKECIISTIEEVPTADVVEVVRCKNCKWWKSSFTWNGKDVKVCVKDPYEPSHTEDFYCADGERRDDDRA